MDTPWDSIVISNLCSVWKAGVGSSSVRMAGGPKSYLYILSSRWGEREREPYLKVVKELLEGHLLTVRL